MRCILIIVALSFGLISCKSLDFSNKVTQQGNLIPKEKIDRIKKGMSKNEVAIIMGTSLMSPLFDNDRWDYAYTWRVASKPNQIKNVSIYFKYNKVVKVEHNP